jgi:16S rRNA A1518/A1519 N6-dimethyltransferase RsmA/KsgA/DIM1 with predicted DNA glycosylase/AP lyase activity
MEVKKRDYRKFFTYPETAKFMADQLDPKPGQVILEPSAGNGALVKAVKEKCPRAIVFACEIDEQWESELKALTSVVVIKDFLEYPTWPKHNGCIANPPFGNGTDLKAHVDRMIEATIIGGKLVILVPEDFDPGVPHNTYPLENWSKNSDGTTTPIKIIEFVKP